MAVVIETTAGDFTVDLFTEHRPRACENFLKLCKMKYYNFSLFHKVQRDFIAQMGDPDANGRGGSSVYGIMYGEKAKYFEGERTPKMRHTSAGTVSFASHGDNMFGSQFFITLADDLNYLDGEHCIFGCVTEGCAELLAKLNDTVCDDSYRPYQDIRVCHTVVLHDPFSDPPLLRPPSRSPEVTRRAVQSNRIAVDECIDDADGLDKEQLDELMEEREARARATILEMIGDLPDVESAPPENVLFVCKLNPVTSDDDLKIIFARFGKIVSCEIIRDHKTGASLQYGFIEFDNPRSCESAYFKMDNVLIDDRRIHVDFSQSVSRVRYHGKGRVTYDKGSDAGQIGRQYNSRGRGAGNNTERVRHKERASDRGAERAADQDGNRSKSAQRPRKDTTAFAEKLSALGVDKLKALLNSSSEHSDQKSDSERERSSRKKKKKHKKSAHSSREKSARKHSKKKKKSNQRRRESSSSSSADSS